MHSALPPGPQGRLTSAVAGGLGSGLFEPLQRFSARGLRSFALDAAASQLLIACQRDDAGSGPGAGSRWWLRKESLLLPGTPGWVELPVGAGVVRDVQLSPSQRLAAVASHGAGLVLASTQANSGKRRAQPL